MDSRLKERLIGAAVLVALGVWLIPWLLDGPAESPPSVEPELVALDLPAPQDAVPVPVRSQTIRLDAGARPAQDGVPVRATAPTGSSTSRAEPRQSPVEAPATQKVAATAPTVAADEPRAAKASMPSGGWVVQLGSFGDAANAERLATRVETYGYDARVSDFRAGGRVMHRVRVGPHETRNEAEAVASALSAHGFVAQVVTAD